ncbi:MAG: serine/threonine-protein kinase [Acidobacteriota bacterium]
MSVGQTISGRYEIFSQLGRGGMGEVFAATDLQLERKVALKAIRSEYRLDPVSRTRFLREARALSRLEHDSICRIYDYIEGEHQDYLVLELIDGVSLRDRLKSGLDRADALLIAEQIGDALGVAHAEGLVHRDLKPANVMITADGRAKILDFGLARAAIDEVSSPGNAPNDEHPRGQPGESDSTSADTRLDQDRLELTVTSADLPPTIASPDSVTVIGSAVGTPRYMSPEQARGEEVGSASDMFSFGLLLHEMFTGSRAYSGPAGDELMDAIASGRTATVRGVGRHLFDLIERLESPAPSRRPTAVDATSRLRWIRAKPQRRLRWAAATLLVFVAIGAGIKYTLDLRRERAAAEFRRSQSDRHIEFMVGELYKRLEPVGRIDILEDVGRKALEYFETLSEEETTNEDRARLARTLTQIGHVHLTLGDLESATAVFERSASIHQELVDGNPADNEWQIGLSAAHFGIGNVAWLRDDLDQTRQQFEIYLEISTELMARDPEAPKHRLEMAFALTNMAALHEGLGEYDRAINEQDRAVEIKRRLVEAEPDNKDYATSLANALAWLARSRIDNGDHETGLGHLESELALRRTLAGDGRDATAQQLLSTTLNEIGLSFFTLKRYPEAEESLLEALTIARRLAQLDPGNTEWRLDAAVSSFSLGKVLLDLDRLAEALPLLEESFNELKALLALGDDAPAYWHQHFGAARYRLALLGFREGRHRRALRILADGPECDGPFYRANDLVLAGKIHAALGDAAAATRSWGAARQVLESMPAEERSGSVEELSNELVNLMARA